MTRLVRTVVAILCLFLMSACTGIGQLAVRDEINSYNDVIADTNAEQLLQNIVRAKHYERPSFFDIVEVDQTKSVSGNLQGGSTNIGAVLGTGSLTSTLTLTDSPILKYTLPSSAGYIAQVLNPTPLSTIANLNNSNAAITPLLDFVVNRLTPSYIDDDRAIDLIDSLDTFGAIDFRPTPDGRMELIRITRGLLTRRAAKAANDPSLLCLSGQNSEATVAILWANLANIYKSKNATSILLRSPDAKKTDGWTVLTRSALGSLRLAEANDIAFIDQAEASDIIRQNKAASCYNKEFYYLPDKTNSLSIDQEWNRRYELILQSDGDSFAREQERALAGRRALIIIETSAQKPENAYIAVRRGVVWYSIDDDDDVSKMNFALLGNIMLVQAQAPQAPTTPTVISAAGSR